MVRSAQALELTLTRLGPTTDHDKIILGGRVQRSNIRSASDISAALARSGTKLETLRHYGLSQVDGIILPIAKTSVARM